MKYQVKLNDSKLVIKCNKLVALTKTKLSADGVIIDFDSAVQKIEVKE